MGWVFNSTPGIFTPWNDPVRTVQEADWTPRVGLEGCRKPRPHKGFDPRAAQCVASRYS